MNMDFETVLFLARAAKVRYQQSRKFWITKLYDSQAGYERFLANHPGLAEEEIPKQQGWSYSIKIAKKKIEEIEKRYQQAITHLATLSNESEDWLKELGVSEDAD